jgi:hypothetical protein
MEWNKLLITSYILTITWTQPKTQGGVNDWVLGQLFVNIQIANKGEAMEFLCLMSHSFAPIMRLGLWL